MRRQRISLRLRMQPLQPPPLPLPRLVQLPPPLLPPPPPLALPMPWVRLLLLW